MADRLDWPPQFERTPERERSPNNSYDVSLSRAFSDLEAELKRLGVDDHRYSFDARQRKRDQRPYSRANPDDPAFVLRWTMDGEQFAVACDRYTRLRDNVRTVGHYLREKRKMENRPVTTGESEFSNLRLPAGPTDDFGPTAAHQTLGVGPDADESEIRAAFREKVKKHHPDHSGGQKHVSHYKRARDYLLSELHDDGA